MIETGPADGSCELQVKGPTHLHDFAIHGLGKEGGR